MYSEKRKISILLQVAIFFVLGVLVTGILGYFSQQLVSQRNVLSSTENYASKVADEVIMTVRQYPAHRWLMEYWYEHAGDLEIEYDAPMKKDTKTAMRCALLQKRHPDLQIPYATTEDINALPAKDQKLYAEIIYSWLITEVDRITESYQMDFLFVVLTDKEYSSQFFLLSGASTGVVRGTKYGQVYPLGKVVSTAENKPVQDAMRNAHLNAKNLTENGIYMDYYAYMDSVGDLTALVGLTFSVEGMKSSAEHETIRGTFFAVVFQILLALICLTLIYLFMIVPLKKVQKNIRLYKLTKDSEIVIKNLRDIQSRNEIRDLSEDISSLTKEIDDYLQEIETITSERERIEAELNVATRIQADMLPSIFPAFPDRHEFEIYAEMHPAREVGGDFYDFFMVDDDHLCMVIADVSGKGVPAALFMVIAKTLIKTRAQMGESPSEILAAVNDQLCEGNESEMFVSVWIAILQLSTGEGLASNAGHEHPALQRAGEGFELVTYRHDLVIGGMEGLPYREHTFRMEPGDTLFVYTDGLPEATNENKELFDTERMLEALNEESDRPLEQILNSVKERAMEFTGSAEQFDDLTMLAMRWNGPDKES